MKTDKEVVAYAERCEALGNAGLVGAAEWMNERTARDPEARTVVAGLYTDYGRWCMAQRRHLGTRRAFSDWLIGRGVELGRGTGGIRLALGIALKLPRK